MCTMIAEQIKCEGCGKGATDWFTLKETNVSYDHPFHAPLEHALNLDFVNEAMGPGAWAAVELNVNTALDLVNAIQSVLNGDQTVKRFFADGSGKSKNGWFTLEELVVEYDAPDHAPMDFAVRVAFVNESRGANARVEVEISADSAMAMIETIQDVLEKADAGGHIVDAY